MIYFLVNQFLGLMFLDCGIISTWQVSWLLDSQNVAFHFAIRILVFPLLFIVVYLCALRVRHFSWCVTQKEIFPISKGSLLCIFGLCLYLHYCVFESQLANNAPRHLTQCFMFQLLFQLCSIGQVNLIHKYL